MNRYEYTDGSVWMHVHVHALKRNKKVSTPLGFEVKKNLDEMLKKSACLEQREL